MVLKFDADQVLESGDRARFLNNEAISNKWSIINFLVNKHIVKNEKVAELLLIILVLVTLTSVSYTHLTLPTNREV